MATEFTLVFYADDPQTANRAQRSAFDQIRLLDERLNDYVADSELSRLSAGAPHAEAVTVSQELSQVLEMSLSWSRLTDGAFDVTIGPLTKLWRRTRALRELPSQERLEQARSAVGYQAIELEGRRVRLTRPGMRLDLGGIAKGYALDAALKTLNDHGITQALVRAGGEFVAGQPPPSQPGWPIALAGLDPQEAPSKRLLVSEAAVATSGDAWQFVELAGRRYSHIVDPATGLGLTRRISVTVVAPSGVDADALATAFCVLGSQRSRVLVSRLLDGKLPFLWMRAIQVSDEGEAMEVTAGTLPPTVTP